MTKSKYAEVLNALDEMQRSFHYASRRNHLAQAEQVIVQLEHALEEKDRLHNKLQEKHDNLKAYLTEKEALIDRQARELERLHGQRVKFAQAFMDRMNKWGNWDDGCFYYNNHAASELQELIATAEIILATPAATALQQAKED